MMNAKDRYLTDPLFHALVDYLTKEIERLKLSPSEIRDAAILACIRFEMNRTHPAFYILDDRREGKDG